MPFVAAGAATDTVRRFSARQEPNQDTACALSFPGRDGPLAVASVCDGLGGMGGGERAAQAAIRSIVQQVADAPHNIADLVGAFDTAWIDGLHKRVLGLATGGEQPATTATLALAASERVLVASVGDSRIYHLKGARWPAAGRLSPLVFDNLKDPGAFLEAQKDSGMEWCVGGRPAQPSPGQVWSWREYEVRAGDVVFCCSDGAFDNFSPVLLDLFAAYAALWSASATQFAASIVESVHLVRRMMRQGRLQDTGMRDDTTVAAICWGPPEPLGSGLAMWHRAWQSHRQIQEEAQSPLEERLSKGALPRPFLDEFLGAWCGVGEEPERLFQAHYTARRLQIGLDAVLMQGFGEPPPAAGSRPPGPRSASVIPWHSQDSVFERTALPWSSDGFWVRLAPGAITKLSSEAQGRLVLRLGDTVFCLDGVEDAVVQVPQVASPVIEKQTCPAVPDVGEDLRLWLVPAAPPDSHAPVGTPESQGFWCGESADKCLEAIVAKLSSGDVAILQQGQRWLTNVADGVQEAGRLLPHAATAFNDLDRLRFVAHGDAWLAIDPWTGTLSQVATPEQHIRQGVCRDVVRCSIPLDFVFERLGRSGWPLTAFASPDLHLAPFHCEVYRVARDYYVRDLHSENGVWAWTRPLRGDQVLLADRVVEWNDALAGAFLHAPENG